ncbi:NADH-ubiquinone oxidoreductase-F iron-sulfur binding region domain-containing protein [Lacrimispora sp.]|uniref:NADH-ubiquinone oxidoreductase-F iron-sulfur binding region domain-containing protein n=1 Tax=Lacrimispora sp. TaxID=2719234 RepID=UPI0028A9FFF8|nr:NADH-ubiquinone oxidoreductase-F iron-sulfur binding region domain-containing protein [Lacrimispora sp.]
MMDTIICNAMPVYHEAPVSPMLLKDNTEKFMEALLKEPADIRYLIVPEGDWKWDKPEGLTVIETPYKSGFTYGNDSALIKVTEGEKPIPLCRNHGGISGESRVMTVEELLNEEKKKVYVGGKAKKKGFLDFDRKTTPRDILAASGVQGIFKTMYFGHPMGVFINETMMDQPIELTTDYIEILNETDCMLDFLLKTADRYGKEACGRCVFGNEGVFQIRMLLTDMTLKKGKMSDVDLMLELCHEMKQQSLCESGFSIANTVESALDCFKIEIEEHITKKSCKAGVCQKFLTFHILLDLCTGCMECLDVCEDDAILGKKKFIHVIDQNECSGCGACIEACEENAIIRAGADKPKCPKKPVPCKH